MSIDIIALILIMSSIFVFAFGVCFLGFNLLRLIDEKDDESQSQSKTTEERR